MSEFIPPTDSDYDALPQQDFTGTLEDPDYVKLSKNLEQYRTIIRSSRFWKETIDALAQYDFTYINCYALGSPSESKNALYQFAYLVELAEELSIAKVALFDPIFTKFDQFLAHEFKYEISFKATPGDKTLYFLPHAPLDLTEYLFVHHKPLYLLSNDLVVHTDRFTKLKLLEKYKQLSLLVNLADTASQKDNLGFQVVKKRSRRKQFVPPPITYDYSNSYFDGVSIVRFQTNFNKGDEWGNSFSDLAFHVVKSVTVTPLSPS